VSSYNVASDEDRTMTRREDGGPAFPRPASIDTTSGTLPDGDAVIREQGGMTLRDYFAAQALTGLIAWPGHRPDCDQYEPSAAAEKAFALADAMLKARGR
jgi:hypothetical protein